MISKVPIGIPFLDDRYGGTYRGRAMLVTGRAGSGKSVFAMQFLGQGLQLQERCLMLSARPAEDVAIQAEALGMPARTAIEVGNLILLEYSDFVPGRDREDSIMLPPDGFEQLREIIENQVVQRVALDTVLPWVSLPTLDHLPDHIFSLVRAFDRLGTTTLFTIPRPVSTMAHRLHRLLEDVVPVAFTLMYEQADNRRVCLVNKYLGRDDLDKGVEFDIRQGKGIGVAGPRPPAAAMAARGAPAAPAALAGGGVPAPAGAGSPQPKVSFANLILGSPSGSSSAARTRTPTPPKANFLFSRPAKPEPEERGDIG